MTTIYVAHPCARALADALFSIFTLDVIAAEAEIHEHVL